MACPALNNLFLDHAMLVRNDVVKVIEDSDFYIKRIPKEPWLDGNGYQYSYPIYERSMVTKPVTDADFFVDYATLSTGATGANNLVGTEACNLAGHTIDSFGISIRTVSLKKAAINSPDICLEDLKFQWQVMDQIKNVTRVMAENTKWVWSNTYQTEYVNAAANKITAGVDGIESEFTGISPTSTLTFGILEDIHQEQGFNGGSINPSARVEDGTPVYTAVGSTYTFNKLKTQSDNNRNDFSYAMMGQGPVTGSVLGAPTLGGKVYHGYKFAAVQLPPRYEADALTRVYPYSSADAGRGKKWDVAQAYKDAPIEDTVVYHDDVLRILIPKPGVSVGGMTYQQQYSWAGDFVWRNIPDRECNIDGDNGFFRARFAYGVKLERPDLAFVIRHLRCDLASDFVACS